MSFETGIYTDVSTHEAVDGVDGFNFQSVSAGFDGTDQRAVRELMLHQNSTHWPLDRDELEHPPTAAYHKRDGRWYFSRGKSTGKTANGRRGNQLTQAIVAHDTDDIQLYRPAQLLGADQWLLEKTDSTSCDPWTASPKLKDGFDNDSLFEWLANDEWMKQVLPAYLTMLEGISSDKPRKVVLVDDDIDEVLRWIALGTLLLETQNANDLEFRAFVADPYQTSALLVGMHPELMPGPLSDVHVLNISAKSISEVTVSESAKLITDWIFADTDTYDALEIIGIARRWMPAIGNDNAAAGAEMVTGHRKPARGPEEWNLGIAVIQGLASNGLREDLELYLVELTDSIAAYDLQDEADFKSAARATRFAVGVGIPGLADALLSPTLESLGKSPAFATAWVRELNSDGSWDWSSLENHADHARSLSEILAEAPDEALSGLLSLVKPLSPFLVPKEIASSVKKAAKHVRANKSLVGEIDGWFGAEMARMTIRSILVQELESDLNSLLMQGTLPSVRGTFDELCEGDWDFLDPDSNAANGLTREQAPFASWLIASKIARIGVGFREAELRKLKVRPWSETWRYVLAGTDLPVHAALWAAWIEMIGANSDMQNHIVSTVNNISGMESKTASLRQAQLWLPLVEAITTKYPGNEIYGPMAVAYHDFVQSIPTLKERASGAADSIKGLFKGRKKEQ